MSDDLFSLSNRMALSQIAEGKPGTEELFALYRARDIELMEKMSNFGGPAGTGVGSAIPYEGDVVISTNQNLSGLHYYNTLTISSGVVITAVKPLIIIARSAIDLSGATITATGMGNAGGVWPNGQGWSASFAGSAGGAGGSGGSGGNGEGALATGLPGGPGVNGVAGGQPTTGNGANGNMGAALTYFEWLLLMQALNFAHLGGAGGGAGSSDGNMLGSGQGGFGGGIIRLVSPTVTCTGGSLLARGANGGVAVGNAGGGGGGGGGFIWIDTKNYLPPSVLSVDGGSGGISAAKGDGAAGSVGVKQINIY